MRTQAETALKALRRPRPATDAVRLDISLASAPSPVVVAVAVAAAVSPALSATR